MRSPYFSRYHWQLFAAALLVILAVVVWFFAWRRGLINADQLAGYRLSISDYREAARAGDETNYEVAVRIGDSIPSSQYLLAVSFDGETRLRQISNPLPGEVLRFRFPVKITTSTDQPDNAIAQARLYVGNQEDLNNLLLQQSDVNGIIK